MNNEFDFDGNDDDTDDTSSAFAPTWQAVLAGLTESRAAAGKKVTAGEAEAVKRIAIDILAKECVLACVISGKYAAKVKGGDIVLVIEPAEYAGLSKQIIPSEDQPVFERFREFCEKLRVAKPKPAAKAKTHK